jgi:HK97 family phage major capsid protein
MAVTNAALAAAWTPEDYGTLVDTVVAAKSVAFTVSSVIDTRRQSIRVPLLTADPATAWFAENTSITLADPTTGELEIIPKKVAGRTQVSNESASDSEPAVATQIGTSLARSLAKGIDAAYFANTTTNGPSGVLSVAYSTIDTGSAWESLDNIHDAKNTALSHGANLTHIVLAPDVALALAKAKTQSDSNQGLFDNVADGVTLAGLTVAVSPHVAAGNAWAVDQSQVLVVRRTGTTIVTDSSIAFDADAVQIRATSRIGFGFANPAGIVRLYDAA